MLSDSRFSVDATRPGYPRMRADTRPPSRRRPFVDTDPPEHVTYRRMLNAEFTVRRITAMRPDIERVVDGLLDAMVSRGSSADLVSAFALPLPSLVICRMLGVPYDDHEFFESRTRTSMSGASTAEQSAAAMGELFEYLEALFAQRQEQPADDLISKLATGPVAQGALDRGGAVGMILVLLVAGHETTANMISLGLLTLLRDPGLCDELRRQPERMPMVVEELLRYHSITDTVAIRVALADVELGGQLIKAGDGVVTLALSANHDEEVFEHPDRFDPDRGARHHLAFGYGPHQCIGQNLARAELEIAYRRLLTRLPDLRVAADVDALPYKYPAQIFGVERLPVQW
nr:putative cytochrome P450 hydroxylase [Kibdelosporangium sp. MJ126-NF4]CTQ98251.1 putative cytochrome P450 hydroxylase [Kibdelosporangium sp. MJ126-NF4]